MISHRSLVAAALASPCAATPAPIVDRLREAFTRAVTDPGVQEWLGAVSFNTRLQTGPELAAFMNA